MELRFEKYQGLGNDFLVVDVPGLRLEPDQVVALCDRHLGVGADGVLFTGLESGRPFMRVINADGSEPQMCGNGLRCVALHLARTGQVPDSEYQVDTGAGPHRVQRVESALIRVGMRPPSLEPIDLPLASAAPWIDEPVDLLGETLRLTAVSMGNPHAVTFDEVGERRLRLGPALEVDPRFPERVNVGFARMGDGGMALDVWERGCGWTRACGTGACAAAVAAVETGRAPRGEDLSVTLPGGALVVRVGARGAPVWMTGPARHVFAGVVTL